VYLREFGLCHALLLRGEGLLKKEEKEKKPELFGRKFKGSKSN
jgi:hypothetical protein